MRFYIEGIEVDVSDPTFYLPINKVDEIIQTLTDYKRDYATSQVA